MKAILYFAVGLLIATMLGCKPRPERATPIELSEETKEALQQLSQMAARLNTPTLSQGSRDFSKDIEARIQQYGSSSRAQLLLAHAHLVEGDYAKGIEGLRSLLGREAEVAEIHDALANAYYDLALLDMVNRKLYNQNPVGFFLFTPDDRTRLVLRAAKAEFDAATKSGKVSATRDRLKNMESYLSGKPSEIAVTIDQAKADEWLLALSKNNPSLTEQVKRNLDAFRWMLALQNPPPIPDSTVNRVRGQHHASLNKLNDPEHIVPLKGTYDLGCAMSAWTQMWTAFQILARQGAADSSSSAAGPVKALGGQILEYANLLSIDLSDGQQRYLRLQTSEMSAFTSLSPTIEHQLESKRGRVYRQIYALAYSQSQSVTLLRNQAFADRMWQQLAMVSVSTLDGLARDLNVDPALQQRATDLKHKQPSPELASEVIAVADELFTAILWEQAKRQ